MRNCVRWSSRNRPDPRAPGMTAAHRAAPTRRLRSVERMRPRLGRACAGPTCCAGSTTSTSAPARIAARAGSSPSRRSSTRTSSPCSAREDADGVLSGTDPPGCFFLYQRGSFPWRAWGHTRSARTTTNENTKAGGPRSSAESKMPGGGPPAMLARRPAAQPEAGTSRDPASVPLSQPLAMGQWDSRRSRRIAARTGTDTDNPLGICPVRPAVLAPTLRASGADPPAVRPCRQQDDGLALFRFPIFVLYQRLIGKRWRRERPHRLTL